MMADQRERGRGVLCLVFFLLAATSRLGASDKAVDQLGQGIVATSSLGFETPAGREDGPGDGIESGVAAVPGADRAASGRSNFSESTYRTPLQQYSQWLDRGNFTFQKIAFAAEDAPGRGRGFVSTDSISVDELLFILPYSMSMTVQTAKESELKPFIDANPNLPSVVLLALHILFERNKGTASRWHAYIQHLPGIGDMRSTIFWNEEELAELQGCPLLESTRHRLKFIERVYDAVVKPLTTVGIAGSPLFTEASLTKDDLKWALATVWGHSTVVYPNGSVTSESSGRLAMVPILDTMAHSGGAQNNITFLEDMQAFAFFATTEYKPGDQIALNLGNYSSSYMLLNHGITSELPTGSVVPVQLGITLHESDPLIEEKISLLQEINMTIDQSFEVLNGSKPPSDLLTSLRLKLLTPEEIGNAHVATQGQAVSLRNERAMLRAVVGSVDHLLDLYATTIEEDKELLVSLEEALRSAGPAEMTGLRRRSMALQLRLSEKMNYEALRSWSIAEWNALLMSDLFN